MQDFEKKVCEKDIFKKFLNPLYFPLGYGVKLILGTL